MGKGVSFHPQFIEDVMNNTVPAELKNLVKPWHKTKWQNNPPLYIGSEYYTNLTPKCYRNNYLKALAIIRMYKLREDLTKPTKKKIVTEKNEVRIIKQIQKSQRHLNIKQCCLLLGAQNIIKSVITHWSDVRKTLFEQAKIQAGHEASAPPQSFSYKKWTVCGRCST